MLNVLLTLAAVLFFGTVCVLLVRRARARRGPSRPIGGGSAGTPSGDDERAE